MALHDAQFTGEGWFDPYSPPRAGGWFDNEYIDVEAAAPPVVFPIFEFRVPAFE